MFSAKGEGLTCGRNLRPRVHALGRIKFCEANSRRPNNFGEAAQRRHRKGRAGSRDHPVWYTYGIEASTAHREWRCGV